MWKVFLVDDEERHFFLVQATLKSLDVQVKYFSCGQQVVDAVLGGERPDLIVMDVMMPKLDGLSATRILKSNEKTRHIPIILLTGLGRMTDKVQGLEAGADDFICKPFHPLELRARVSSMLRIKALHDELEQKNRLLEDEKLQLAELVDERTSELEKLTLGIVAAFERANTFNDSDTGAHLHRVIEYSTLLAKALELPRDFVSKIRRYAGLHDIGKVGIPDAILKKSDSLSPQEFEEMKRHTIYGYELLRLVNADEVAMNIALSHHERWDGRGYPNGLAGEDIPMEARIVALADVYDALTTQRVYKAPITLDASRNLITRESGTRFDPRVVQAFLSVAEEFEQVWKRLYETQAA